MDDLTNFLSYYSAWAESISEHHDTEARLYDDSHP